MWKLFLVIFESEEFLVPMTSDEEEAYEQGKDYQPTLSEIQDFSIFETILAPLVTFPSRFAEDPKPSTIKLALLKEVSTNVDAVEHWMGIHPITGAVIPVSRDGKCWLRACLAALADSFHGHNEHTWGANGKVFVEAIKFWKHPDQVDELRQEAQKFLDILEYLYNRVPQDALPKPQWTISTDTNMEPRSDSQQYVTLAESRIWFERLKFLAEQKSKKSPKILIELAFDTHKEIKLNKKTCRY
jgi:hypothetical protein